MMAKLLKNSLLIIIMLGIIIPYLGPANALSSKGLIGGLLAKPIDDANDQKQLLILQGFVGALTAVSEEFCVVAVPVGVLGRCHQEIAKAQQDVLNHTDKIASKNIGWLMKILTFLDEIAYQLFKRVIMDRLVDAFVQWIQDGGKGKVIESWEQFFDDAGNIAAGEFVQGLGAGFLCSPFNLHAQLALIPVPTFSKVTCTLNGIIGNINSFFEDFRSGNWLAYQETWYPRNNFYGGTIIAIDEAARAEAKARDAAEKEGLAGKGFLSWTKEEYVEDLTGPYRNKKGDFAGAGYVGTRFKKIKRTVTPGTVTAEAVTELAVRTPITRLIHSEDLTAYITAIIDASVNVLTKEGIKWLANSASRNAPPKINAQFPCANLTSDAFKACMASVNAEKSGFGDAQAGIASVTTGSLGTRATLATTLQRSVDLQTSYVEALDQLITSGKGSGREQELADEQTILDDLQDKLESNQSFIEALTQQKNKIESITLSTAVTEQDYLNLGNTVNTQFVGDDIDAQQALLDAEKELTKIQNKVNSKLPEILIQLPPKPAGQ